MRACAGAAVDPYCPSYSNLSGEPRKVETDWVAVGTCSGEGLSPVWLRNVSLGQSWMKPTKPESAGRIRRNTVAATRLCKEAALRRCSFV